MRVKWKCRSGTWNRSGRSGLGVGSYMMFVGRAQKWPSGQVARVSSVLPGGPQGSNSGCQPYQQVPLAAELSLAQNLAFINLLSSLYIVLVFYFWDKNHNEK